MNFYKTLKDTNFTLYEKDMVFEYKTKYHPSKFIEVQLSDVDK